MAGEHAADGAVGWFGKLPAHGDFVRRRLDAGFVEPWDAWLAAGLTALRTNDPAGWLDAYLASPSWRFVIAPGVLPGPAGRAAWAGVLMPSVDRVGRYYPLTAACPLTGAAPRPDAVDGIVEGAGALRAWLADLDDVLAQALHAEWDAARLDLSLDSLGPTPRARVAEDAGVAWHCDTEVHGLLSERAAGLPQGEAFAALLARRGPGTALLL